MTGRDPVVVDNVKESRYEILVERQVAGAAVYRRTGSTVAFLHTVIDSEWEGRGLGAILARRALDAAREEGAAVLPFCPFIREYIQRHPDYLDLVPVERRADFQLTPASGAQADRAPSGTAT
jgi:uncharacterized protein